MTREHKYLVLMVKLLCLPRIHCIAYDREPDKNQVKKCQLKKSTLTNMEVVDRRAAGCKTGKGEEEHRRLFSPRAPFSRHQASPEGH